MVGGVGWVMMVVVVVVVMVVVMYLRVAVSIEDNLPVVIEALSGDVLRLGTALDRGGDVGERLGDDRAKDGVDHRDLYTYKMMARTQQER